MRQVYVLPPPQDSPYKQGSKQESIKAVTTVASKTEPNSATTVPTGPNNPVAQNPVNISPQLPQAQSPLQPRQLPIRRRRPGAPPPQEVRKHMKFFFWAVLSPVIVLNGVRARIGNRKRAVRDGFNVTYDTVVDILREVIRTYCGNTLGAFYNEKSCLNLVDGEEKGSFGRAKAVPSKEMLARAKAVSVSQIEKRRLSWCLTHL